MARDLLQIVDKPGGGLRPSVIRELNDALTTFLGKGSYSFHPPSPGVTRRGGRSRWQGYRTISDVRDNGTVSWSTIVKGSTVDECLKEASKLAAELTGDSEGRFIRVKPGDASYPSYHEVRGPVTYKPKESLGLLSQRQAILVELSVPVAPLVEWDDMVIFDDFSVPGGAKLLYTNLVTNPSFEVNTAKYVGGSGGVISRVTTDAYIGSACLRIAGTNDSHTRVQLYGGTDVLAVEAGATYAFTCRIKPVSNVSGTVSSMGFTWVWRDASDAIITSPAVTVLNPVTGVWAEVSGSAVAPTGAVRLEVWPSVTYSVLTDHVWHLDAVCLLKGTAAPVYFDGDSDKATWTGTPHASTSELYDRSPLEDWTFEIGAGTLSAGGGVLVPKLGQKRLYFSGRGYDYEDVQVTLKFTTGAVITGNATSIIFKYLKAGNHLLLDINGQSAGSGLQFYKRDNGLTYSLGYAFPVLTANTTYWLRARIEGNVLTGELFSSEPQPMSTPLAVATYTLVGADAAKYGVGVKGKVGLEITPPGLDWRYDDFRVEPLTYRNQTLPAKIVLGGSIPGDAPAKADLHITPSGGSAAPVFAAAALDRRPTVPSPGWHVPFGVIEAEASNGSTFDAFTSDANSRGGSYASKTAAGAGSVIIEWVLEPWRLRADEFKSEVAVDVYAVLSIPSTLLLPRAIISAVPGSNIAAGADDFGVRRYGELGTRGRAVVAPSSGTSKRPTRLGVIKLPTRESEPWILRMEISWGAGSSGVFGVDYLVCLPARSQVSGPTGKNGDASYPRFTHVTTQFKRVLLSDGSGRASRPPGPEVRHIGMGSPIEPPPGNLDLAVFLASLVPDAPALDLSTLQLAHSATVHAAVTPRSHGLRGN